MNEKGAFNDIKDKMPDDFENYLAFRIFKKTWLIIYGPISLVGAILGIWGYLELNDLKQFNINANETISAYNAKIETLNEYIEESKGLVDSQKKEIEKFRTESQSLGKLILEDYFKSIDRMIESTQTTTKIRVEYEHVMESYADHIELMSKLDSNFKSLRDLTNIKVQEFSNNSKNFIDSSSKEIEKLNNINNIEYIFLSQKAPTDFSRLMGLQLWYEDATGKDFIRKLSILNLQNKKEIRYKEEMYEGDTLKIVSNGSFLIKLIKLENHNSFNRDYAYFQITKLN